MFDRSVLVRRLVLSALFLLCPGAAFAGPFDDPGIPPSAMVAWATAVESFSPGPIDIESSEESPLASFGLPVLALGAATLNSLDVVSLGDGGAIVLEFEDGIGDGVGADFAVFENGFFAVGGLFAEFAFVEVSTNGADFIRFPVATTNEFPVPGFGTVDPTDFRGLAGDQPIELGTGFDLFDLLDDPLVTSGDVDLNDIRFVRIVDIVGNGSTTDDDGMPLYDPFSTPFASGGFDLEAIGVLHEAPEPGSGIALMSGVLGLAIMHRRRRGLLAGSLCSS